MTWHIVASNGTESRVVTFAALGGVDKTTFGDEESAEIHAAVLAARNPGWEFEVRNARRLASAVDGKAEPDSSDG